jgi:hypothetical protein
MTAPDCHGIFAEGVATPRLPSEMKKAEIGPAFHAAVSDPDGIAAMNHALNARCLAKAIDRGGFVQKTKGAGSEIIVSSGG